MLGEIFSSISSVLDLSEKLKRYSFFNGVVIILIGASIALVKPIVFYSTLYFDVLNVIEILIILFVLYLVIYIFCNKKVFKQDYDNSTLICLFVFSIIVLGIIIANKYTYNSIDGTIFSNYSFTQNEFRTIIHNFVYSKDFYYCVFSHIELILFDCFKVFQMLILIYLIFFTLKSLLLRDSPIRNGFDNTDYLEYLKCIFLIFILSPFNFANYLSLWNNIF